MVVLGAVGAYLGYRLPVPAGVLLGTLVAVGAVSIAGPSLGLTQVPLPPGATPVLQILLGTMGGLRMDRDALRSGRPRPGPFWAVRSGWPAGCRPAGSWAPLSDRRPSS